MPSQVGYYGGGGVFSFCNGQNYTKINNNGGSWSNTGNVLATSSDAGWESQDADKWVYMLFTHASNDSDPDIVFSTSGTRIYEYSVTNASTAHSSVVNLQKQLADGTFVDKYLYGLVAKAQATNAADTNINSIYNIDAIKHSGNLYSAVQFQMTGGGSGFTEVTDSASVTSGSITLSLPSSSGAKTIVAAMATNPDGSSPSSITADVGTRINQYRENTHCHAQFVADQIGDIVLTVTGTFKRFIAVGAAINKV